MSWLLNFIPGYESFNMGAKFLVRNGLEFYYYKMPPLSSPQHKRIMGCDKVHAIEIFFVHYDLFGARHRNHSYVHHDFFGANRRNLI
jgi:hypothetical protein